MAISRKDNNGRVLRQGESQRKDGIYQYRTMVNNERIYIYASTLKELRDKEKGLQEDIDRGINVVPSYKNMTLNQMFENNISTKDARPTYIMNCRYCWDKYVKDTIGNTKLCDITSTQLRMLYMDLSRGDIGNGFAKGKSGHGLSRNTIRMCHNLISSTLELAVDDNLIRRNPAVKAYKGVGSPPKKRNALTQDEQDRLYEFMSDSATYSRHLPMVKVMIGTGCRVGETIALTWDDVDLDNHRIYVTGELIYKDIGEGFMFYEQDTKTVAGNRVIPMTNDVESALIEQRMINEMLGYKSEVTIGGRSDFIFITKNGNPMMPSAVNSFLKRCVDAYNKQNPQTPLPHISAHILRHTCATRMGEKNINPKVTQAVLGHQHPFITLDVYTHASDGFILSEMRRMDEG